MSMDRERRGYTFPPARRGRRPSIRIVLWNDRHQAPEPITDAEILAGLPPEGRRALLADRLERAGRL